ncbi:Septin [Aphelenchoides fujianensis]|nr:Septin [Aphelenchoides fujianensis]
MLNFRNGFQLPPLPPLRQMPPTSAVNTALSESIIGFSTFPDQVFRRCIKDGFEFSFMVVGESGLGKSTFINSLFLAEIYDQKNRHAPPASKTTEISTKTLCLEEDGVRLNITFVDTPGFGDHVNNTDCWKPIVKFVEDRFSEFLSEETRIERPARIEDKRVHLCLYFIAPRHGLSELDITAMKALQDRVNIVPVIAKADTLMADEMAELKKKLQDDFVKHEIKLYEFPAPDESKKEKKDYRDRIPFAVIGSNELRDNGRTRSRVRKYQWGTVEVDNLDHNDFIALRDMLINQNMMDLIEVTRDLHYENFRARQMQKSPKKLDEDPFTCMEREQRARERELEQQQEMKEKIFAQKVGEKMKKLEEEERRMTEKELKYKAQLDQKRNDLMAVQEQIRELCQAMGINHSNSSLGSSPDGGKKKKTSTLSLFRH